VLALLYIRPSAILEVSVHLSTELAKCLVEVVHLRQNATCSHDNEDVG
jgi:hypothetical protein